MLIERSTVKPVLKCSDFVPKEMFKSSQCLLTISVGQEAHESEKFAATVKLVNENFASCVVLIDDTLQRHTMALQRCEDAEFFYKRSLEEGDLWLIRNSRYLSRLTIPHRIIRWDKWLMHPNYAHQQKIISALIHEDPDYNRSFEDTIREFLRRYHSRVPEKNLIDLEKDFQHCFDYLLEECTALCLWPELNCEFEVYPSKRNLAMAVTHERFVLPKFPHLLHGVHIKFKNRKQLKAQSFGLLKEQELNEFY